MTNRFFLIEPKTKKNFSPVFLTKKPDLAFMQTLVGGPIEIIPGFRQWQGGLCIALCNEEGKIKNLPFNETATEAWKFTYETSDYLVGNVLIFQGDTKFLKTLV